MRDRHLFALGVRPWRAVAALLLLLAAVCLMIWSDRPTPSGVETTVATRTTPTSTPVRASTPEPASSAPATPRPARLLIPDLDLDTRLITLGVRPDNTVEVPSDAARAGWFRRGPVPGSLGSSVILGHVDSVEGPGVFARLSSLTAGAWIEVRLDDGSVITFAVRSVRTYANSAFPARKIYGSHGRSELNLITCGGVYDASRGGYQSNVVVNARLV